MKHFNKGDRVVTPAGNHCLVAGEKRREAGRWRVALETAIPKPATYTLAVSSLRPYDPNTDGSWQGPGADPNAPPTSTAGTVEHSAGTLQVYKNALYIGRKRIATIHDAHVPTAQAKANAQRMALCWNNYDALADENQNLERQLEAAAVELDERTKDRDNVGAMYIERGKELRRQIDAKHKIRHALADLANAAEKSGAVPAEEIKQARALVSQYARTLQPAEGT